MGAREAKGAREAMACREARGADRWPRPVSGELSPTQPNPTQLSSVQFSQDQPSSARPSSAEARQGQASQPASQRASELSTTQARPGQYRTLFPIAIPTGTPIAQFPRSPAHPARSEPSPNSPSTIPLNALCAIANSPIARPPITCSPIARPSRYHATSDQSTRRHKW